MKIRIQLGLEHGVLFLYDPHNDVEIPADTGAASETFTETCIAFHSLIYVDGDADVTLSDLPYDGGGPPAFSGHISVESRILALSDSRAFSFVLLPLKDKAASVDIWREGGNDLLWVRIRRLDFF